jgi:hypothetical protein
VIEFLVFFALVLFPVFAEVPDYDKPYAPIFTDKSVYSWTDKVKMTIIAPSWNTDRHLIDSIGDDVDYPINISTREHSLKRYKFTETDVNSGTFTAEIILTGFPHDVDGDGKIDTRPRTSGNGPTNGFLEVNRDSAITISFEFADGVILTESVPVHWNVGTIQFSKQHLLSNQPAQVQIVDPDMNLNPETLDRIPLHVYSDSDVAGIDIDAIETSENSGIFVADLSFSQNLLSSGSRLFAVPGDSIYAKYDDYTLPKPYTTADHIEIVSIAKLDFPVPSTDIIKNSQITLSNSFGKQLQSFSTGNQIQIVGTITNNQNFTQQFVYLFQIKDANDTVVSISWIKGEISPNQSLDVSQSWTPLESGNHLIETFVWTSLIGPIPLSLPQSMEILVE